MAKGKKFYTVWVGRNPGVYDDWDDAREQIDGFSGAAFKSFDTPEEAAQAYRNYSAQEDRNTLSRLMKGMRKRSEPARLPQLPAEVDPNGWAVDASCLGNPGVMEYRGVHLASGQVIFKMGPFKKGTNNIGEFLAIVHAAALMKKRGQKWPIYTDSRTALSWIRNRGPRTKLERTPENEELFELLRRATLWLQTNGIDVPIVKWETEKWGEIPADFGRK